MFVFPKRYEAALILDDTATDDGQKEDGIFNLFGISAEHFFSF